MHEGYYFEYIPQDYNNSRSHENTSFLSIDKELDKGNYPRLEIILLLFCVIRIYTDQNFSKINRSLIYKLYTIYFRN